jgi:hypothetical protein
MNPDLLRATQFGSEYLIRCGQHKFGYENLICYKQHNSAANTWFTVNNTIQKQKPDSLQTTQIWQRIPDSLCTTESDNKNLFCSGQYNSTVKTWFTAENTNSAANTWFVVDHTIRQQTLIHYRQQNSTWNIHMHFGSSTWFVIKIQQNHIFSSMNYMQFGSSTQFVVKI